VLDLELVQTSGLDVEARLRQLGYEPDALHKQPATETPAPVYAENARRQATEIVRDLLVQESLRYGIACSATAFVATRKEAGQRVAGTVAVANALAHGWSDDFLTGGVMFARMASSAMPAPMAAMPAPLTGMAVPPPAPGSAAPSGQSASRLFRAAKKLAHGLSGGGGGGAAGISEAGSRVPGSDLAVVFSGTPAWPAARPSCSTPARAAARHPRAGGCRGSWFASRGAVRQDGSIPDWCFCSTSTTWRRREPAFAWPICCARAVSGR